MNYPKNLPRGIRIAVLDRDDWMCQLQRYCDGKCRIEVHHIDGNRENNLLENLITVCKKCHTKLDRIMREERGWYHCDSKLPIKICPTCGKNFTFKVHLRRESIFCSRKCIRRSKVSEEERFISFRLGRILYNRERFKNNPELRKKHQMLSRQYNEKIKLRKLNDPKFKEEYNKRNNENIKRYRERKKLSPI